MTTYRDTYIPPRPSHWPFPAATATVLLLVMGAVLLNAPGLMFAAWVPVMWFGVQILRCIAWGAAHGEEVSR